MQKMFLANSILTAVIIAATFSNSMLIGQDFDVTSDARPDSEPADTGKRDIEGNSQSRLERGNRTGRKSQKQRRGMSAMSMFNRLDKNNDGQIVADEVPEKLKRRMARIDTDKSSSVSMEELETAFEERKAIRKSGGQQGPMQFRKTRGGDAKNRQSKQQTISNMTPEKLISRFDKDNDQQISLEEVPTRLKDKFAHLDTDGNNQLGEKELVSMIERLKAEGGKAKNRYSTDPEKTKGQLPKRPPRTE